MMRAVGAPPAYAIIPAGLVGNGVFDDKAAIQAAIDRATAAGGGIVWLPAGKTYAHSDKITITSNVTIWGYGATLYASDPTTASGTKQSVFLSGDNITLLGLKFTCNWDRVTKGQPHRIRTLISSVINNLTIRDIEIDGAVDMGLVLGAVKGLHVSGCYIHDTANDGIHISHGTTAFEIIGNRFENTGDDNLAVVSDVVDGNTCNRGILANNSCMGNRTNGGNTAGRNIAVAGGADIIISGNMCQNSNGAAIMVQCDPSSGVTIGVDDVTIIGNEVINSNVQNIGTHADIYVVGDLVNFVYHVNRVSIIGNKVRNNAFGDGIRVGGMTSQTEVLNNYVQTPATGNGILVTNAATDVRIVGNIVRNAFNTGISVTTGPVGYLVIEGNMVDAPNQSNTSQYGIHVQNATGITQMIARNNTVRAGAHALVGAFTFDTASGVNVTSGNVNF